MCLSEVPTGKESSESILASPGMWDFGNQAVSEAAIENVRHLGRFPGADRRCLSDVENLIRFVRIDNGYDGMTKTLIWPFLWRTLKVA